MIERSEYASFAAIALALADKQIATSRNKIVLVMAQQLGGAAEIIQELLAEVEALRSALDSVVKKSCAQTLEIRQLKASQRGDPNNPSPCRHGKYAYCFDCP